ncbi:MAG: N-acetyltransferase family protein [Candidatus Nanohaloarchaea archaeon]
MVTVRDARAQDIGAVREVLLRTVPSRYDGILADDTVQRVLSDWYDPDDLEELVARDDARLLVAEDDRVVGFCAVSWDPPAGELEDIHVDPEADDGLRERLLSAAIQSLPRGVHRVGIGIIADHDTAAEFYRNHGFEKRDAFQDEVFDEQVDRHLYVRML